MKIDIPKGYLRSPNRSNLNYKNSYSAVKGKGSIFGEWETVGFKLPEKKIIKHTHFCLDIELDHQYKDLLDEIKQSSYILDLKEGWGDDSAAIKRNAYFAAVDILVKYATHIHKNHSYVISTPEINPVRNGSIDLLWDSDKGYLIVNVNEKDDKIVCTFFGYANSSKKIKEGEIDSFEIEPGIALWVTDLI